MTITTANLSAHRPVNWPGNAALRLTPLALAVLLLSTDCRAEWRVTPSLTARETWSDNIGSLPDDQARSGFISELAPSISIAGISVMTLVAYYISWSKRQDKPTPKAPAPKPAPAPAA